MTQPPLFAELARRLGEVLPGKQTSEDLEKTVKTVAQSVFSRLDLVTREEFDAQVAVLARSRERIQQLEARILQLSQQIDTLEKADSQ
jgi:BMFP domain-containing protein YqiC